MHIRRGTDDSGLTLDDDFPACLSSRRAGRPQFSAAAIWRRAHQISALTPLSRRSQAAPRPLPGRSQAALGGLEWRVEYLDFGKWMCLTWLRQISGLIWDCDPVASAQYHSTHARLVYNVDAAIIRQHVIRVYMRENTWEAY
jgi:hypothetical protein